MYDNHVPIISAAMREDYETFRRGLAFVVCSIRQPIMSVPDQLAALFDGGEDDNPLFGHKWQAWDFILSVRCRALWERIRMSFDAPRVIFEVSRIPGIGIVKAGFVAQLMGCDVACLDSRNIKRDGRNVNQYRSRGGKQKETRAYMRKIEAYAQDTGGKSRKYWDTWCREVGKVNGITAEEVSALHLAILPPNYIPGF
jgi:hypothetical protein